MPARHAPVITRRHRLRDLGALTWWVACAYCKKLKGPYHDMYATHAAARLMTEEPCLKDDKHPA
jgi:hypothetical protein